MNAKEVNADFAWSMFCRRRVSVVRDDIVPFVRRRAGDEGHDRLRVAHIEDFMRDPGLDVNEIARLVFQDLLESGAEFVPDFPFENVKDHLEPDVNVGVSDTGRRDRGDICG